MAVSILELALSWKLLHLRYDNGCLISSAVISCWEPSLASIKESALDTFEAMLYEVPGIEKIRSSAVNSQTVATQLQSSLSGS